MKSLSLNFVWNIRSKLWAEGNKLRAEGNKLWAEWNKLLAEGDKLWAEGDKLRAEGNKLWAEAVIECYGNVAIEWNYESDSNDYSCTVEGVKYEPVKGGAK